MPSLIAIDDTDSRQRGMCTTYVGTQIRDRLREAGSVVHRLLLIRCHPAIEHKTRGNAAVCLHTTADPALARQIAKTTVDDLAEQEDPNTNPGLVIAPHGPETIPESVGQLGRAAMHRRVERARVDKILSEQAYQSVTWDQGRGLIGALAAIGAWECWDEWTYEVLAYRPPERWGQPRSVNRESVFAAAETAYPTVWDTVDRTADEVVCVPHTPGPVLYGIRGDSPEAVRQVSEAIESEPIATTGCFITNQGTDAHLQSVSLPNSTAGTCVRTNGTVTSPPTTRSGGHVFFELTDQSTTRQCAAFEPTKRFRDRVRNLRVGDRLTVCGEISEQTIKLEKFAIRKLTQTELVVPTCPECGRSMESAGAGQGYRCRDCGTQAPGKETQSVDRTLDRGWYEVPPVARRHVAKPLVRGGFDAPVHPEQ